MPVTTGMLFDSFCAVGRLHPFNKNKNNMTKEGRYKIVLRVLNDRVFDKKRFKFTIIAPFLIIIQTLILRTGH